MPTIDPRTILRDFPKSRDFFIGIDSDGCAFDTMEVKHKECFIPNIIRFYDLASISRVARETAEFVNLYSANRGINRFPALTITMDLLANRPEVRNRGVKLPELRGLRSWIDRETKLGNPALKAEVASKNDPDLKLALAWSEAVNVTIGEIVRGVPPFPYVRESLVEARQMADLMVCSATPGEALTREWEEHGLDGLVSLIAGQELGSKKEHLALTTSGRYEKNRILMIGDAPGDRKAAESIGVLFYPIDPGFEDESWRRFIEEALPKFFDGTYAGAYMNERLDRFVRLLPEAPPWKIG